MDKTIKVGILDDEELVREGIKYKFPFTAHGFEIVYEGDDGNDLLAKLQSSEIILDLLLIDMIMPKIKGIDFIKKAQELKQAPTHYIVISGYDDFSYVKEALKLGVSDYLLKPIDPMELEKVLLKEYDAIKSLQKKQHEKLHNELVQFFSNKGDIDHISAEAKALLQSNLQHDAAVQIFLLGNLYSPHNFSQIKEQLEEKLSEDCLFIWMYGIPQLFVFISRKDTAPSLLELIDYPTVTALTFESVSNIKSLPSLFTKAVSSLPLLLTLGQKVMFTLHCEDEIRSLDRESSQNSHFAKIMTSDDVNTSFNALTLLLDQPILQNKKEHAFRTFVWKHYQSEVLLESLQSFDTPKLFREYCLQFITLLNEKKQPLTGRAILDRVVSDMEREFANKKTLKDYADRYYIHPNYLARLFKQELNVTFIDTLTKIRMEAAKTLLQNESLQVSEIAQLVGLDDVRYFGQVFRKITNMTPTQYRQR